MRTATLSLTDRLLQAFPSGSFCLPAMLELAAIEETDSVPTAAVECAMRPRLLLNPHWIEKHAATPEKLVMLTLHELHHVVLGHTRLYPRATSLDNLVFDAVINSMLCHLLPDPACTTLMTDFYDHRVFPECFLRPAPEWKPGERGKTPAALQKPELSHLAPLHRRLYSPEGVGYEELREALRTKASPNTFGSVPLLGDHRDESDGASSAGQLEIRSPALLSEVSRIVERWPQPPTPIRGRSLADVLGSTRIVVQPASNARQLASLLLRVAGVQSGGRIRAWRDRPHPVETPIPSLNRRSTVLRSLGCRPLLHRSETAVRQHVASGDLVHIYLDVSGSVGSVIPALYGAVLACMRYVHPKVHLFSTIVADVNLSQLRSGVCKTTNGTCIECVGSHMEQHRVRRAVLITDGHVGKPGASTARVLERAIIGVAMTPSSDWRADLEDFTDHWAELSLESAHKSIDISFRPSILKGNP